MHGQGRFRVAVGYLDKGPRPGHLSLSSNPKETYPTRAICLSLPEFSKPTDKQPWVTAERTGFKGDSFQHRSGEQHGSALTFPRAVADNLAAMIGPRIGDEPLPGHGTEADR